MRAEERKLKQRGGVWNRRRGIRHRVARKSLAAKGLWVIIWRKPGIERPGLRGQLGIWHPEFNLAHLSVLTPHYSPHFRHSCWLPAPQTWPAHPWYSSASHSHLSGGIFTPSPDSHSAPLMWSLPGLLLPSPGPHMHSKPCLTPLIPHRSQLLTHLTWGLWLSSFLLSGYWG